MSGYTVVKRDEAFDAMAEYPGFGEMRFYTQAADAEQVAITWRSMPPDTGGRGSYGHRHSDQEEIYLVIRGNVTFKVGDDVFEVGPHTAVRVACDAFRSVHNDSDEEAEMVICSVRGEGGEGETEMTEGDFWAEAE
jgi:mannose-6-phosphate isomerase-like protein (cupin superfamily)